MGNIKKSNVEKGLEAEELKAPGMYEHCIYFLLLTVIRFINNSNNKNYILAVNQ